MSKERLSSTPIDVKVAEKRLKQMKSELDIKLAYLALFGGITLGSISAMIYGIAVTKNYADIASAGIVTIFAGVPEIYASKQMLRENREKKNLKKIN